MRRCYGKLTSSLAARVRELRGGTTTTGNSLKIDAAPVFCGQAPRQNRRDNVMSNPLEGRSDFQGMSSENHDQDWRASASSKLEERDNLICWTMWI